MIRQFLFFSLLSLCFAKPVLGQEGFVRVNSRNPRYLETNGKTFIPVGPNICFARGITHPDSVVAYYSNYFLKLAAAGGNFTRIWLSVPVFDPEKTKAGEYDPSTLTLIDEVLDLAKKHGIRVKFCLEHFRRLTGAPAPFPTSVRFDKLVYEPIFRSMDEYFTSTKGHELFLGRVRKLAERYRNHPHVFGWELWNEMNTPYVSNPDIVLQWTRHMLPAVKAQFPNHLVMQTLGSYESEHMDKLYRTYSGLPGNELAQAHRYIDEGAPLSICQAPMDELSADAVRQLLDIAADRPVILSEVGAVEPRHAGPSRFYPQDTLGVMLHDLLFAPFFTGAAGPGQSWHWDYYIEKNNLWWHFARFREAIGDFDPVKEEAVPIYWEQKNPDVRVYGLKGKSRTLLWIREASSNWKTEFIDRKPVAGIPGFKLKDDQLGRVKKWEYYDPWKNCWTGGKNRTPSFTRSILVKIQHP